jgi:hypothetical protein
MTKRRLLTYIFGGLFIVFAVATMLFRSWTLFFFATGFQLAMFLPEWGGRK